MFSVAGSDSAAAKGTRSSRRRPRPTSSDSLSQQPKAKRQRLPLTDTTFVNPDVGPEMFEVKPDKGIDLNRDGVENWPGTLRKDLTVRSKKPKSGDRVNKGDGSVVLVI
jgi:nuclear pore complex protein Nup133